MSAKHTPGPWKVRKGFIPDTFEIFHPDRSIKRPFTPSDLARVEADFGSSGQGKANAHLIAAAPALLEALQEILADGMHCDVSPPLHRKARAAIALATGDKQ
jgi:hypothetical protein